MVTKYRFYLSGVGTYYSKRFLEVKLLANSKSFHTESFSKCVRHCSESGSIIENMTGIGPNLVECVY